MKRSGFSAVSLLARACFLFISLLVVIQFEARGQSYGSVNFANAAAGVNAPVWDGTQPGNPLCSGTNWMAQLYFAPGLVTDWSLLTTNGINYGPATFLIGNSAFPGYFFGGKREIEGYPSKLVTLQVRTWLATSGASWETATVRGESNLLPVWLAGDVPAPNLVGLQSWGNFFVPEPSTWTLALCGGALVATRFLWRRRRR